jgi:hypothetical protein
MTFSLRASCAWSSPAKAALMLAFAFSQMPTQAAPKAPSAPPEPGSAEPAFVAPGPAKAPHHHRATKRGLAKPEMPSTQPQQLVRGLR